MQPQKFTEPQAKEEFEKLIPTDLFTVRREVTGSLGAAKRIKQKFREWGKLSNEKLRIDYILSPTPRLIAAGWELEHIGIEIKTGPLSKTGSRFGRVVSQLFDYQSGRFLIDSKPIELTMIFLFTRPYERFGGLEASILMQEGIGVVKGDQRFRNSFALVHGNGMHPILRLSESGPEYSRPRFGMKHGSR